ncbi:DUF6165 family protein [Lichenifustis flavocetrariae]|uniref:DUF6165 family protein n=1 Tax=Lichenifustis flavocetrariae TaxID=2949735 RepID=A0AA42CIL7_9HYPH|nr:DUF6165 family protein [Lichenifustis flavocetrariae]MCW6508524.1 DUF6165 family protein [Lichenifustis flavocetrariae]
MMPYTPEDHGSREAGPIAVSRETCPAASLMVEIGAGELIDKITILRIKAERIGDPARLANVHYELAALDRARQIHLPQHAELQRLEGELMRINTQLWEIEDDIRACEKARDFGPAFVALARAVYKTNDRRAAVKKEINVLTGASIVEEKSYAASA